MTYDVIGCKRTHKHTASTLSYMDRQPVKKRKGRLVVVVVVVHMHRHTHTQRDIPTR